MAGIMASPDFSNYQFDPLYGVARQKNPAPTPVQNQYRLYNTAVGQQAGDYDSIMGGYKDIFNQSRSLPNLATPSSYRPVTSAYNQSPQLTSAISNLSNLSQTGGYSDADVANLRARGISPIRSIYANAQQNLNRQRALQGGYSPNYGAVTAKMARDLSSQIADQVTNVNAGLAQNIAANKLAVAPQLASVTGQQSDIANRIGLENANIQNRASEFNTELPLRYGEFNRGNLDTGLRALSGMQSLYGTTPALSSLYGSQAMNSAQMQNMINQQNAQRGLQYFNNLMGGLR